MYPEHLSRVDLNLLPALMALLEERHVSRAANRVGLSQSAMSRALQRLRRLFDDELLVRGPDGYVLTPRGQRVRVQLAATGPRLDRLFAEESFNPAEAAESFRLAVNDYTVSVFGSALTRTIRTESPNSTVSYELLDDHSFDHLDSGTIDLLVLGRTAPQRFRSERLSTDRFLCIVAADHALAKRRSLSLAEYIRWPHLVVEVQEGGQPVIDRTLRALGATRRIAVATPLHVVAPAMVPGTDLVLTFPARLVPLFADPTRISTVPAPREIPDLQFYAVWHPRVDNDPRHQWLRGLVRAAIAPTLRSQARTAASNPQAAKPGGD